MTSSRPPSPHNPSPRYRLGVDIGGTFTDVTVLNEATGEVRVGKVPSTPHDPAQGFSNAVARILEESALAAPAVGSVVHGTTVATNAIIEGKIARTAFLTTEGFQDLLEIGRQARPANALYDVLFDKPRPLVPRYRCFGVRERLDARGQTVLLLDEDQVRAVAQRLRADGVESVAVCLLHAYANPTHEQRVGALLRAALPDVPISLSAEVAPEFREYFRASTTVINAGIRPIIARYLREIEARLRGGGLGVELLIMQSNGGVYTAAAAAAQPVLMVESGPAAGVIAASYLGEALGYRNVLAFDMGGTTAKAALIQDGQPQVTKEYEVGAAARAGISGQSGSGYPIRTPVLDLVEIGAGGGSIAWVDSGGALRVGPHSAGADPGPACYGRGGTEPTVTDANLVLGRLNPDFFLGGRLALDVERARVTIEERCASRLGLSVTETAWAIVEIANVAMMNALRLVSVQRGYDPREFVLIAFGGAGPVHANRLADAIEIGTLVVPRSPGTTSALGLLVTDLKREYTYSLLQPVAELAPSVVENTFRDLEARGSEDLAREAVRPEDLAFVRQLEVRYLGQSYELTVTVPATRFGAPELADALAQFHRAHDRAYGYCAPEEPVELVNLRLSALGKTVKPRVREIAARATTLAEAQKAVRPVYFAEREGFVPCPIYDRERLSPDQVIPGPAVIEEFDSTTVIQPGFQANVDRFGNLLVSRRSVPL